jgi:hypothetical protein
MPPDRTQGEGHSITSVVVLFQNVQPEFNQEEMSCKPSWETFYKLLNSVLQKCQGHERQKKTQDSSYTGRNEGDMKLMAMCEVGFDPGPEK